MVAKPATLALDELKSLPRHEVTSTLECSGNNGLPFATSTIGNARWAGASLAETLRTAQIKRGAVEVVLYGVEQGEEAVHKDTPIEFKFTGNFARSMSIDDAMNPANLSCSTDRCGMSKGKSPGTCSVNSSRSRRSSPPSEPAKRLSR